MIKVQKFKNLKCIYFLRLGTEILPRLQVVLHPVRDGRVGTDRKVMAGCITYPLLAVWVS